MTNYHLVFYNSMFIERVATVFKNVIKIYILNILNIQTQFTKTESQFYLRSTYALRVFGILKHEQHP